MKNIDVVEDYNFYAVPSRFIHEGTAEDIQKLYGSLISSEKTKEVFIYSKEMDWKVWPTNLLFLAFLSGFGFLLSGGNWFVTLFAFVVLAPNYNWRKIIGRIKYFEPIED